LPKPLEPEAVAPKKQASAKDPEASPPNNAVTQKQSPQPAPGADQGARGALAINPVPGKLTPNVGAVVDVQAKAAVLFLPGGLAKLYYYPEFQPLGVYKLAAGTAHHPIYHRASGRL